MSEVQSRPQRGRTSARGGRGGPRGGARAGNRHVNGDSKTAAPVDTTANEGELGDLKKQYTNELAMLKEMFPGWTDADLLLALQDSRGDVTSTIDHITSGAVNQFAEVPKKTKDKTKSHVKEAATGAQETGTSTSRPPRGRGAADTVRGTRGRPDRGRGGFRGGARGGTQAAANGTRSASGAASVPTTESSAWDAIPDAKDEGEAAVGPAGEGATGGQYGSVIASDATPNTASEGTKASLVGGAAPKKTWASMFATPKPPPVAKIEGKPPQAKAAEQQQQHAAADTTPTIETPSGEIESVSADPAADVATPNITPSKDPLTEENIEHLPDYSSKAPMTETAASQVGSSHDIGSATPSLAQQPIGSTRPLMGGYATSATKAMAGTGRSASFQRRVQEQQEALVMPGQHATDRVGVQFGMMGLNGDALEVDEDREDAETRPQAPPLSPPSQPRASLPPAPRQPSTSENVPETIPTPKQAPGLPPVSQQQQQSPNPIGAQIMSQQGSQGSQGYNRYGGLGQSGAATEAGAPPQRGYDPFGQPASQNPLDAYNSQQGQQSQAQLGGQNAGPGDYSSYYGSEQQRYQNYYGQGYGQQHAGQQDAGSTQQRSGSALGSAPGDTAYSAQSHQGVHQSRYGEQQGSGNNTPNPQLGASGQQSSQGGQQIHQQHHGQGQQGSYPNYGGQGHPYYNSPYYQAYMNQYNYGNQGYGGPYGGGQQGGRYGQSHQGYGMPPSGYGEHSSSPANTSSYGQSALGRDGGLSSNASGLGDYGRSGSTQPSQTQGSTASQFGGLGSDYGRQTSYGGGQGYGQQSGQQSSEDSLKPYGDAKASGGPSPGLGQPGRPGSATNNSGSQGPQSQSHQQGYGGYPSQYGSQGSQYGSGLGGLGGHQGGQNHQGSFGQYGGGGYGNYGSYGRGSGGWGNNYGSH